MENSGFMAEAARRLTFWGSTIVVANGRRLGRQRNL
jgi:hypothetical protein|tara:strand:+ start:1036 stop:1143 length:108 start_codon:yes stop_codon:yes gene_type:complete